MGRKYTYKRNENHNRNENLVQLKNLVAPDMAWKELRWWWYLRNGCTKKATKWCNESCWNGGTVWNLRRCRWGASLTWTLVSPLWEQKALWRVRAGTLDYTAQNAALVIFLNYVSSSVLNLFIWLPRKMTTKSYLSSSMFWSRGYLI